MNKEKDQEWAEIKADFTSVMETLMSLETASNEASTQLTGILKRFREHLNLSQEGAAKIMGVSPMYVSLLERGKRPWTARSVERLLKPILCI